MYDDQLKLFRSVRTEDVAWKTCRKRGMIETDDERELAGRSMLAGRHDTYIYIYIYIYILDLWYKKIYINRLAEASLVMKEGGL